MRIPNSAAGVDYVDAAIFHLDLPVAIAHLVDLLTAYVLALPVAWERELSERTAGLRTFPLVAIAACAYTITGVQALTSSEAEARVIQGLITGMGFIGGGAILKDKGIVTGTATAAGLWSTGAVGMAVALKQIEVAVVVSLMTFLTLRLMSRLKHVRGFRKEPRED
ncbi:MgtC/SapB family protein [Gilvimarinus sp. F26214L]|uniref:MgtC/SapB family protein n=1 Tax=Gilvimarinus sp. DZF01 TaxID=3461371 RepID=UPI0040456B00